MTAEGKSGTALLVLPPGDKDEKLIASVLKKVGFDVLKSETKEKALDLAAPEDRPVRIAVVDAAVAGPDLPDFLVRLHHTEPEMRMLCLCGQDHAEEAQCAAATSHVGGGYLKRPFRRSRFVASVLEVTDKPLTRTA
jgi:response regulator RpfG family c-di-GMP phosphodiesterase